MDQDNDEVVVAGQTGGVMSRVSAWVAHPFTEDMDLVHWFLFLGMVIIAVILWVFVINKITDIGTRAA